MNELPRETVDRWMAAMNSRDPDAAVALLADDVVFWEPTYPEPRRGREAVRRELEGFFAMLPDIRFTTRSIVAEERQVVHEFSYHATYEGRPVEVGECAISRFDPDGRISEVRVYFDRLTLLRQLGLAPDL